MTRPAVEGDLRGLSTGALAYVGDAVYELHARLHALGDGKGHSGAMHRRAVRLVKATYQAGAARRLLPELTEEEAAVFRRGRNNTAGSLPKHADPVAYRAATGLEAVFGYLFLKGETTRVDALMDRVIALAEEIEASPAGTPVDDEESRPAERGPEDGGRPSERNGAE